MAFFQYTLIKREEISHLRREYSTMNGQIIAAQLILTQVQNKEWSLAIDHSKRLQNDALANGLISLTENLKEFWALEETRSWVSSGLLEINKVIGRNYIDISKLSDDIVGSIVNYVKANQGALFIINHDDPNNIFFEMHGCFAYQRKKFLEKRIMLGEGLLSQCYREGDPIYLTNIPPDYIKITSGLGEALPRCLIILPLKASQKVIGIFELAFFRPLQLHEREFLNAACELIATAMINLQANQSTRVLLAQSETTSSELKKKQEELRHSLEEMQAIQEDLSRKNEELQKAKQEMEAMTQREKDLIESKLITQQLINDKVISTLKLKIERLQKELREKEQASEPDKLEINLKSN